jgi:hypothetical protein
MGIIHKHIGLSDGVAEDGLVPSDLAAGVVNCADHVGRICRFDDISGPIAVVTVHIIRRLRRVEEGRRGNG